MNDKTISRLYLLIDRSDAKRKSVTLPESEATPEFLKRSNDAGFNVYVTVNAFRGGRRREEDIAECRYAFVDVDLPKGEIPDGQEEYAAFKKTHADALFAKIASLSDEFGIFPEEVNETYKGFHVLYPVTAGLSGISKETYFALSSVITAKLDGDMRCRDLARVYKVPGFLDRKEGRDFEVARIMKDAGSAVPVSEATLAKMGIAFVPGTPKGKPESANSTPSSANHPGRVEISSVPFSEILSALESDGREFDFSKEGRMAGSDGIIWNRSGDYVNDFSHGKDSGDNRANGNWNFLKNVAFEGDSEAFSSFLSKFGIRSNMRKTGVPILTSLLIGISSGSYKATRKGVSDSFAEAYEREIGSVNSAIALSVGAGEYYRMLIAAFAGISDGKYREVAFDDGRTAYEIDINNLMVSLGMKTSQTSSRKSVMKLLATAQFLRKPVTRTVTTPEGETVEATGSAPLMDVMLSKGKDRKVRAYVAFNAKANAAGSGERVHYMNRGILALERGRGSGKKTAFAVEIDMWTKSKGVSYNCSLKKAMEKLGLSYSDRNEMRRAAKSFAESLVEIGLIREYSFNSPLWISMK